MADYFGDLGEPIGYDNAIVCENGHEINDRIATTPEYSASHCSDCGAKGITKCECGQPIRGGLFNAGGSYDPPAHCSQCGKPHVWTVRKKKGLESLIGELDDLSSEDKKKLVESIPDLVVQTPMSETAAVRVKKALDNVKPEAKSAFYGLLKQVGSAAVLKMLGL